MIKKAFLPPILFMLISFWSAGVYSLAVPLQGEPSPGEDARSESGVVWTVSIDGTGQFQSIQEAIDQAQAGDTIRVKAGHYQEDVTVHSKDHLKVIGQGMDMVTIAGLNRVGTLHIGKWPYGATNVLIQGMTIEQHGGLGVGIFNGNGITLRQVRVNGMVFGQQVERVKIEYSVIGGSETTGMAFADSTAQLIGNFIHDNDHGVAVGGGSDVQLIQNVIVRSLFEGVMINDQAHVSLLQNTIFGNGRGVSYQDESKGEASGNIIVNCKVGFLFSPKSVTALSFNALYNNADNYLLSGMPVTGASERQGKTDVYVMPKFVAPERGDFHLQQDSPLVNMGDYPFLGALPPVPSAFQKHP